MTDNGKKNGSRTLLKKLRYCEICGKSLYGPLTYFGVMGVCGEECRDKQWEHTFLWEDLFELRRRTEWK